MMDELEVDAFVILRKDIKVRSISGTLTTVHLVVLECESPYVLIFVMTTHSNHSVRMDVNREELADEIRKWMKKTEVRYPCVNASHRLLDVMNDFIKHGKPPKQNDLIAWILSRSELRLGSSAALVLGGFSFQESSRGDGGDEEMVVWDGVINTTLYRA